MFSTWCWNDWIFAEIKMKMNFYVTPTQKINLKWIIDLNVKIETKSLEQNIGRYLCKHGLDKDFFDVTQKKLRIKEK